jgi:uncharacterized protein YggT (Ycf19 family)
MSAREPYDQERIVRHTEVHDEPTEVLHTVDAGHAHYHDHVVTERPATSVYGSDAIREDVTIDRVVERRAMLDRISSIVWFATGLLAIALGLRVAFRLLAANETAGFVQFIYGFTEPFVRPFQGIFAEPAADGAVLDSAALFALVIYALIAWIIVRILWLAMDRPESGARRSVAEVHRDRI